MFRSLSPLLSVLMLLAAAPTFAGTGSIDGIVRDRADQPVVGAQVLLQPGGVETTTDEAGRFSFAGVPAGNTRLLVLADGHADEHVPPFTLAEGETKKLAITVTLMFRQELVVTGTRTPRQLADVPIRVEVVEKQQIEKTASRTLADAVEFQPGVRVESNCQNCNFSQVRLLGLDGAYSQILFDSQPVMSSLAAVYGIEHIPARLIERLEVVKGGGSALYGPGSVAGVINVIPHEPVQNGGSAETRFSWMDGAPSHSASASFDFVAPSGNTAVTVFTQVDSVAPIDVDGDTFTELGERDLEAGGVRLTHKLRGNDRLTFDWSRTTEDRRGGNKLHLPEHEADIAEAVNSRRDAFALSYSHVPSEFFDAKVTLGYNRTKRDSYYGAEQDPNAYGSSENPLLIADILLHHAVGRHDYTWGVQHSNDQLEDRQPAYDLVTDEEFTNTGVYFQDEWRVDERWTLLSGARVDKHSEIDDAIISPRAALRFSPRKDINLRVSVASGFRPPQVFDEDLHITQVGGEGQVIKNDPNLEEERSWSFALGGEWLPRLGGAYGRIEVNAFYTALDGIFALEEADDPMTPGTLEFRRFNQGQAKVYGTELSFSYNLSRVFNLDAGFVFQKALYDDPEPDFGSREIFRTPERYGILAASYKIPRAFDVFLGLKYSGSMKVPHFEGYISEDRLETSPSFFTVDLTLSREFELAHERHVALTVSAGVKNLTDEFQEDLDQGVYRDAGYVYGPRSPRAFFLSTKLEF